MLRRFHWLPLLLVLAGAVASLATLTHRYGVEARARAVALVLDYAQFRTVAAATGVPLPEAFRRLRSAGITGVALTEETLGELQTDGVLRVSMTGSETGRAYRVEIDDPVLADRVVQHVSRMVRSTTESTPPGDRVIFRGPGGGSVYVPGRFEDIRSAPTGLDPQVVASVRAAGLEPVGRINNALGVTAESLEWDLARLKELGITTVIFAGDEVLGYRTLVPKTAETLRSLGFLYGSVEFGKQRGDDQLSRLLQDRLVRVHSISNAEMPRLAPNEAVERYVRAAVERNIRLNYVRLPGVVTEHTFDDSVDYVRKLSRELARAGFGLAAPVPFSPVWPDGVSGRTVPAVIALGIGASAVLLLAGIVPLKRGRQAGLAVAAGLLCALVVLSGIGIGLQLVALLAAIVFPALAFVLFPQPVAAFDSHEHANVRERSTAVVPVVAEFAALSAVTLVGAVMVAGLLSDLPFMVKVRSFAGIKAATVLPILLVGFIYLSGMSGEYPSWQAEREAVLGRLRRFFSEPLRVWHTVAGLVGLVALALLLARSGNDAGVGVSDLELRFRALLDRLLVVRPRTKEFMIGHPALLLGLAMAVRREWRAWAFPLLLLGIIGQVGMLNSFCHLHTPIKITVLRTFNGLWTGGLVGLALIAGWTWVTGRSGAYRKPLKR